MPRLLPLLLTAVLARSAPAAGDAKAVETLVRGNVDKVLEALKDEALDAEARKDKVMEIIEPLLDLDLMAKLTLGRKHWPALEAGQQKSFTEAFTELLKASYFEKLDLFTDEKVEYDAPVPSGSKFEMMSYVVSKGDRIKMLYKVYKKGGSWRVYDLEIEGVSIVKSYGSQYQEYLQTGTFDGLLAKMRARIDEIKAPKEPEQPKPSPPETEAAPAVVPPR